MSVINTGTSIHSSQVGTSRDKKLATTSAMEDLDMFGLFHTKENAINGFIISCCSNTERISSGDRTRLCGAQRTLDNQQIQNLHVYRPRTKEITDLCLERFVANTRQAVGDILLKPRRTNARRFLTCGTSQEFQEMEMKVLAVDPVEQRGPRHRM